MPSTDFTTIRAAVETKLNTLVGAGQVLGSVKDIHTGKISSFPCATFEPSGNTSDFITNDDNLRAYAFDIVIHQEIKNAGRGKAITILSAAVDAVLSAFDEDFNLGGACDFQVPVPSNWGEYTGDNGAVKYAMLTVVCKKEVTVVS